MSPRIVHIANPMVPELGLKSYGAENGAVVSQAIREAKWKLPASTFLLRRELIDAPIDWRKAKPSEIFVRRSDWDVDQLYGDDVVVLVSLPQGGGGGNSGSQILKIVAQIGLIIAASILAPGLGTALAGALEIGVQTATAIAFAIIGVGGSLIINAILPAPKQATQTGLPSPSPTYSIGAQTNQARLGQAVPEWFGTYNIVPDLRSQPYNDFNGTNEQLYELFCLGKGAYHIHQLRIGTNVIAQEDESGVLQSTGNYPEISWQIAGPNEAVDLFPDNVVTSSEVSNIQMVGINEDTYAWSAWFVANPPYTETTLIFIDVALPGGLYTGGSNNSLGRAEVDFVYQAQKIDDLGNTLGDPFTILDVQLFLSTNTPVRSTYQANVPCGRYQVRGERTNKKAITTNVSDALLWMAMRSLLPSQETYGDCTMIAIQATATKNLNGSSSDQFNVIATRMLSTPVEDPVTHVWSWSEDLEPTRSIAAAANYILNAVNCADLDVSRYDQDWLLQYEALWQTRGDTFDGGFDSQQSLWDMLNQCLNVGRSQAIAGPLIAFSRDEQKTVYRCSFSPRVILPASFQIDYLFFDPTHTDGALVTYIDETNWTSAQMLVTLPGSTLTVDTAPKVTAFGMVSRAQVWREWLYKLAASFYRRQFPNFQTELSGRVCFRGDLVRLSHVMTKWGAAADVIALEEDDAGDILTLSEPWIEVTGGMPTIEITTPDGYVAGPVNVDVLDDGEISHRARVQLLGDCVPNQGNFSGQEPRDWGLWGDSVHGLQMERPKVLMGQGTIVPIDALMVSMTPQSGVTTQVACVVDNPAVYTADEETVPTRTPATCDGGNSNMQIRYLSIRESTFVDDDGLHVQVDVTVNGAPDAVTFDYRHRTNQQGAWSAIVTGASRSFSYIVYVSLQQLEVRSVDSHGKQGPWFECDFDADGHVVVDRFTFDFSSRNNSASIAYFLAAWGVW